MKRHRLKTTTQEDGIMTTQGKFIPLRDFSFTNCDPETLRNLGFSNVENLQSELELDFSKIWEPILKIKNKIFR